MKPFGRYNGRAVYKIDLATYVGNKYYKDDIDMYLINGDLIANNIIIGRWDGKMVHEWDSHERAVFYKETIVPKKSKPAPISEPEVEYIEPTCLFEEDIALVQPVSESIVVPNADDILAEVYTWQVC